MKSPKPPTEKQVDTALGDTFPASDPLAVSQPAAGADLRSSPAKADLDHIAVEDQQEVRFWAGKFGVDVDEVEDAVATVGNRVDNVRRHLGK